jgi:predicted permease
LDLSVLITQMLILFLLILCGYAAARGHVLKKEDVPVLSKVVLNLGIPGVVLSSVGEGCALSASEIFLCLAGFLAFTVFCALLGKITVKLLKIQADKRLYEFMYTFSNVGFMGLPVVQAVLGEEVMIYAMLFLIPNNLVLFSYGEYLMRDTRGFSLRSFFSPPIVASLLAVGICLLNLRFPYPIAKVISYVGGITTPLAMIIIGITLLGVQGKEIIKNKDLLVFLVVKMLVLPLVGYGLLYVLSVPEVMVHILILLMAMPIPANTIIYASLYKKNVSLASQTSVLTSLVCIVTIPMVFFVISLLSSF